ncbi:MAG: histidine kinase [Rubrivivax sp.]
MDRIAHDLPADAAPPMPRRAFAAAWLIFWVLMATLAVQDQLRQGRTELWKPLLWEGSSALVATALLALAWPTLPRQDALLATPLRWLRRPLLLMLPAALVFVSSVQALRALVHAAAGLPWHHDPWPQLLAYEVPKFCIFYGLFAALLFGLRAFAFLQAERLRLQRQATLAREAQMRQLAQQIEPHFLFNALNTIAGTVQDAPALADRLITRLAALLRASIDAGRRPLVPLADELELAQAYADIMGTRFGARVQVAFDVDDDARRCTVPVLLLQPLLENAFRHGVERQPGAMRIALQARVQGGRLQLSVRQTPGTLAAPAPDGRGVGLANLRQRLALAFGDAARLELRALEAPAGVEVRVELPCAC